MIQCMPALLYRYCCSSPGLAAQTLARARARDPPPSPNDRLHSEIECSAQASVDCLTRERSDCAPERSGRKTDVQSYPDIPRPRSALWSVGGALPGRHESSRDERGKTRQQETGPPSPASGASRRSPRGIAKRRHRGRSGNRAVFVLIGDEQSPWRSRGRRRAPWRGLGSRAGGRLCRFLGAGLPRCGGYPGLDEQF
jgi:hypothetical protein